MAAVGGALAIAGSLLPWTTRPLRLYRGQDLSIASFAGPRQFTLIVAALTIVAALARAPRGLNRAAAVFALGGGLFALAGGHLIYTAYSARDIATPGLGAWLTVAGAGVAAVSAIAMGGAFAASGSVAWTARLRGPAALVIEGALIVAIMLVALWVGYDIFLFNEPAQFLVLLGAVAAVAVALTRSGVIVALTEVMTRRKGLAFVLLVLVLIVFPLTQDEVTYPIRILASVGVFAAAALGLNVVVGSAGLLDLGYVAFFGIGAYVAAIFGGSLQSLNDIHLPFALVFVMACVASGGAGVVLGAPTLRLRGDYLAIVTLGFGEIVKRVMENLRLTDYSNGVRDIPHIGLPGGYSFGEAHELLGRNIAGFANYYYLELVFLAVIVFVVARLNNSRIGRAWVAIREDELAAASVGVNTIAIKLLAFGVGAFFAGGAGAIFGHLNSTVTPDSFQFIESVTILAMVVLGGMGNLYGVILGATVLIVLPEKLRFFQEQRLLIFGLAIILMMRYRPEGLLPEARHKREFRSGEGSSMGTVPGAVAPTAVPGGGGA